MRLLFKNATTYNEQYSLVHEFALYNLKYCEKRFSQLLPDTVTVQTPQVVAEETVVAEKRPASRGRPKGSKSRSSSRESSKSRESVTPKRRGSSASSEGKKRFRKDVLKSVQSLIGATATNGENYWHDL